MSYKQIGKPGSIERIKGADFYGLRVSDPYSDPYTHLVQYLAIGDEPDRDHDAFAFLDWAKIKNIAFSKTEVRAKLLSAGTLKFRAKIQVYFDFGYRTIYGNYKTIDGDAGASEVAYINPTLFYDAFVTDINRVEKIVVYYDQDGSGPAKDIYTQSKIVVKYN